MVPRALLCVFLALGAATGLLQKASFSRKCLFTLWAQGGDEAPRPKKNTAFERSLNDFIGKRYGAGEAFYGRRLSDLSEAEYQEARAEKDKPLWDDDAELKGNGILVVGGATGVGQWVVYDLVEKGFAVRVANVDRKEAIEVFGLPGLNIDVLPALQDDAQLLKALKGAQAVVLTAAFGDDGDGWGRRGRAQEEAQLAKRVLEVIEDLRSAGRGDLDVRKIVLLSRVVPAEWGAAADGEGGRGPLAGIFKALSGSNTQQVQAMHADMEDRVRRSGLDYAVVRAPPTCDVSREGAQEDLMLLQGPEDLVGPKAADFARRVAAVSTTAGGLGIGHLDLAEAVVQALVQEVSSVTFTVCADPSQQLRQADVDARPLAQSAAMELAYGPPPPKRVQGKERAARTSYYSIIDAADSDIKLSYLLRPADAYRSQLQEDEQVEVYWQQLLSRLTRDQ